MIRFFRWFRDIFCYCGLSKEEYKNIKKTAYVSNFTVWKYLYALMVVLFTALSLILIGREPSGMSFIARIVALLYSVLMLILFFTVLKSDSLVAQFLIYLSMIVLLLLGIMNSISMPGMMAATFPVLLVLLPMFMIDKPYFMAILLVAAAGIGLLIEHPFKTELAFRNDAINFWVYAFIGIIINTFYNYIRVHEFKFREEKEAHFSNVSRLNRTLQGMSESVVDLLGEVVESRDSDSGEHIRRVKGFTYLLARQVMQDLPEYGLDEYTVGLITSASALHDVGKISIPDSILLKPGRLTPEEFDIMKTHCERGCDIVRKMEGSWSQDYLDMGLSVCLNHHEKWEGEGYPHGLKGDDIPIGAQIVSIADIFDALTTKRVYKDAYPYDVAFEMIFGGKCGSFSKKLLSCLEKCKMSFVKHALNPKELVMREQQFEIVSSRKGSEQSFVVGLHNPNRTLEEKNRLSEEVAVLESIAGNFYYIAYVDMIANEVIRFRASQSFAKILDSMQTSVKSNERFDKLLNTIIVSEDYDAFRKATIREAAVLEIQEKGSLTTDFRIRLNDGIHHCRMRISANPNNPSSVVVAIAKFDDEYAQEQAYLQLQKEVETARVEKENREALEDRLAVIDTLCSDYDYVCSLNTQTFEVTVYRAEDWIRDMFKNLNEIVTSPMVRDTTLRGIILPEDFDRFQFESRHENVMKGLKENGGFYHVDYRAYKYGQLVHYQTKYTIDQNNPTRIIIALHSID